MSAYNPTISTAYVKTGLSTVLNKSGFIAYVKNNVNNYLDHHGSLNDNNVSSELIEPKKTATTGHDGWSCPVSDLDAALNKVYTAFNVNNDK